MTKTSLPASAVISGKSPSTATGGTECFWFDDNGFILDVDCFVKTITKIRARGVRPSLIGSIIAHYASTWLPDLSGIAAANPNQQQQQQTESVTAYAMKKRFFVETLIGIIPPEEDSVSCNFLLRLLRSASMVGADPSNKAELEARISWQLHQASLAELMIPSFTHTCGTLLDVELVTRLVKKFARLYSEGLKNGASLIKVAKLVDSYLTEAAVDSKLSLLEFISLAEALPNHSRVTEDGLYRAMDTYLKGHPNVTKQERKRLCELISSKKLSMEASLHAAQNHRLPVRAIIRILFTEQRKWSHRRHSNNIDCSGSLLSRNPSGSHCSEPSPAWCLSKRDVNVQQAEIRRLREGMAKLQSECDALQTQLEKKGGSSTSDTESKWYFRWRKFRFWKGCSSRVVDKTDGEEFGNKGEAIEIENQAPALVDDAIPSSGQVNDTEEPAVLTRPDQPMTRSRERRSLRKAMNQFMELLIEDDGMIRTTSSPALMTADEVTNPDAELTKSWVSVDHSPGIYLQSHEV